ncbi:MAG: alkaline phosphatase [Hellea sp.]|nr:alkaline phosphatase [Hellea sp.]
MHNLNIINKKTKRSRVLAYLVLPTITLLSACVEIQSSSHSTEKNNTPDTHKEEPGQAKNVILFIGDGMGISTITATRIFDGQSKDMEGEENSLAFDNFENVALIKTYNTNAQVPDSAGTATAIMSGYKTNIGTINVRPGQKYEGCGSIPAIKTLTDRSHSAGKSVGIVTTTRITHATPAAMFAHADNRNWESDNEVPKEAKDAGCKSIAQQMVESEAEIIMGGGTSKFSENQLNTLKANYTFAENKADMKNFKDGKLRALFSKSHMSFEADRDPAEQPSLAEMTETAIKNLKSNQEGYVLMVEAGRIDHAHHGTNAFRALTDAQALNEAVKVAIEMASEETLIMVTADHSHVFTMAGYPVRGNPILGLVKSIDQTTGLPSDSYEKALDGKPYTTLGYHNGPHLRVASADNRPLTNEDVQDRNYRQQTAIPMNTETHAGEDVALFGHGPGSENIRGVMEQNKISDVIDLALGLN